MPYEYYATVTNVVDGDTIVIDIDLGFNVVLSNQSVRLAGVDTPESRTSDKVEKTFGLISKEYTKKFVESCNNHVIVRTQKPDSSEKFGRILGDVINPETREVLNESLIKNGYAVGYLGENKDNVIDQHKLNRKRLIDEGKVKMSYKEAGL
jgi:micrococcal nuclease